MSSTWVLSETHGFCVLQRTLGIKEQTPSVIKEEEESEGCVLLETKKEHSERVEVPTGPPKLMKVKQKRPSIRMQRKEEEKEEKEPAMLIWETDLTPLIHQFYTSTSTIPAINQMFDLFESPLGKGCFGEVWGGVCRLTGRKFAIKKSTKYTPSDSKNFLKEARMFQRIPRSPYIIKYFKSWVDTDQVFIQTELCHMNLSDYSKNGPTEEIEVWWVLKDLLRGLEHLHRANLLHNDIKPENCLLSNGGFWNLADFGCSSVSSEPITAGDEGDGRYIAPEVLATMTPTKASDVFSLGLTVLEVTTYLYMVANGAERQAILNGQIPNRFFRSVSLELRGLLGLMKHLDPGARPNCAECLDHPTVKSIRYRFKFSGSVRTMVNNVSDANDSTGEMKRKLFDENNNDLKKRMM
ncbi:hypothetical protein CRE_25932 [Caenorhabditis remanei]|uniref:non-specific serine/threonine protein kinase n=1 Tax=Caenorhabditis remanei TaxID=31234 RepID=E3NJB0_CAERE|nr:hypothetical protein CRE_25932 [Caenorhabditis remanei]